jgi:hypothetical protein
MGPLYVQATICSKICVDLLQAPVLQLREEWKAIQRDREKIDNWHQHTEKRIAQHQEALARELQETAEDGTFRA